MIRGKHNVHETTPDNLASKLESASDSLLFSKVEVTPKNIGRKHKIPPRATIKKYEARLFKTSLKRLNLLTESHIVDHTTLLVMHFWASGTVLLLIIWVGVRNGKKLVAWRVA